MKDDFERNSHIVSSQYSSFFNITTLCRLAGNYPNGIDCPWDEHSKNVQSRATDPDVVLVPRSTLERFSLAVW